MPRVRGSITTRFAAILLGVSLVVLASFIATGVASQDLQSANASRARSFAALLAGNRLEQSVLDLETGLRGYLLAGKPLFLQPYEQAVTAYPALARELEAATAPDPPIRRQAVAITGAIQRYVSGWTEPVIRLAQHDLPAARAREAGGGGKQRVDAMRRAFTDLLTRESALHSGQAAHAQTLASLVRLVGVLGSALFLLLIAYLALHTRRLVVAPLQRLAGAVAALTAGDLSARVPGGGTAEVGTLVAGVNRMAASFEQQHHDLEAHQTELEAQKSELEAALVSLEDRTHYIERVRRFSDGLADERSVEAVAAVALRGMADAVDCEVGALYLTDPESDVIVPVACRGLERARLPSPLLPGETLAGRALAEHRCVIASHDDAAMAVAGLGRTRTPVHELHLPLRHGERTVGVLSLGRLRLRAFSQSELRLLEDLSTRAAVQCVQALATQRLRRTADELRTVLETTDEGVYGIDPDGAVTLVNRAALEMTGWTREELIGRNAHELLHHSHADGSPHPQEECPIVRASRHGEGVRMSGDVFWRRDGTSFPVEYAAYPLLEGDEVAGAVVTFLDRTARRQAQRQRDVQHAVTEVFAQAASLAEARPRLLAVACEGLGFEVGLSWEPSPDAVGRLSLVSAHAASGFEDLIPALGGEAELPVEGTLAGLAIAEGEPVVCQNLDRDPPRRGRLRDPRLHAAVGAPIQGRERGLMGVVELFSSRPIPEEGLIDTLRALARQVAQYLERQHSEEENQRMKDQIVANVSHELRTPLTAIDGWVHVLLGGEPGPLTDEQRRFLEIVKRNSDRLMRLVGDLLVAGQIEAGRLRLELEDVDVAALARETAESLTASAAAKDIGLAVHTQQPVVVHGDRQRLGQLLGNLVSNAIKFTPEHGEVDVFVESEPGTCRIRVCDTGIGISPDEREHLFERFYRASSATKRGIGGTGLGLAISKAIAESHNGTIHVTDRDGPGTAFVVELPVSLREEVYS